MLRRRRMKYLIAVFVYITSVPVFAKRYIEFNKEPSDIVVLRNKPAQIQCSITAKNDVTIFWIKDDVRLDLKNETRRSILPHGSLYFNTIVKKNDGGIYRCVGETIVNGASFKIFSRKAKLTVVGMSKSFSEEPNDLTIHKGETAWFKCKIKRSRPDAKITWSKEGKNTDLSLNFRFVVFPSGVLEILSVLPSDAGKYICRANNENLGKTITAKARLTVISGQPSIKKPSKFLVKPSDVTSLHNKNVILECIVTGYPKPHVDWYKDGKKITLTGHYAKYGASSLKISNVQGTDSGKYECVMGTERAGANLQVFVPPQFTVIPTDFESDEDKNVNFQCSATGFPKPKISWYKNGESVGEIEHITMDKDTITIMEVLKSDEGIYQCLAENDGAEIIASAQLIIRDIQTTTTMSTSTTQVVMIAPTTLQLAPSAPRNVKAIAKNATSILVSWQPPDQPHGIIREYTIVTYAMSPGSVHPVMPRTKNTMLLVTNLKPGTMYRFVVYASNEYKKGALSVYAEESTKRSVLLLGPPRNVLLISISSVALKVTWKPPVVNTQVIKNYSIEYRQTDSNLPWLKKVSLRHEVVLLKLLPYTKYIVKVTAHTDKGSGQTSSEVFGRTRSGIPKGPPKNIQLLATNDFLVARWQQPSHSNGNITSYVLRLKNMNTGIVSNFTTKTKNKVFMQVEKSTTYAFKVAAVTEAGRGKFSQWLMKDMPSKPITEDVLPGKPTNLRVRVVLGMVRVSWDAPSENHIVVREYVLSYGKMTPYDTFKRLPKNVTTYLLRNLQSDTIYIIRVRAANKMGEGLEALERVTVPRLRESSGIYNLRAVPIKKRCIKLSWVDPTMLLRPQDVGYDVKFEKDGSWLEFNVTGRTSLLIDNLRPGMIYKFYVKKNSEINYTSISNTTREEVPSAPKDVTVSIAPEESSVNVHWNTPDRPNGKLASYKICWKAENNHRNWTCKKVKAHMLNKQIFNINASLKYSVKILAKNSAGEGEFSEPRHFLGDSVISLVLSSSTTQGVSPEGNKIKIPESSGHSLTSDERTLWIVIAVIATVTLIAIVVISIVLCKKRSRGTPVIRRKPSAERHNAVPNGKKKTCNNYWIKQDNVELEPCMKKESNNDTVSSTIPRSADEMQPLDSPYLSRKDCVDEEKVEEDIDRSSSFEQQYRHGEDYQPLPIIANDNSHKSRLIQQEEPHNEEASSDYGSEELPTTCIVPNGCLDPDYSIKFVPGNEITLQNLMKDLDAIMAKEDRV